MSLINTDFPLALRMAQAIANPLFPKLDTWLRSGRHISADDLDNHSFLLEYHDELERFYARYQVELIKAPEGFFYLRPRASSEIGTSVLSELDMLVGKVLCYLYLSPERLANEGLFSLTDLQEELLTLADERQLLRMVNQRSGGSDLDKRKLLEKMRTSCAVLSASAWWCRWGRVINSASTSRYSASGPMSAAMRIRGWCSCE